jgi:large subunit ribosomal protein L10
MALTKAEKAARIDRLAHELESSTSAIVGSFEKLTVAQDFELRGVVRGAGGRYRVLKNKLAARAAQGTKVEQALQGLKGVSSVAYTSGDPVVLAKALSTWVQENAQFTFKLGIVDGKLISIDEIKQLSTMPGKQELFAKLLFLINAPAQRLATVIAASGRDLAVVLNQGVEKQKFAGAAAAERAPAAPDAQSEAKPEAKAEAKAEPAAPAKAPAEIPAKADAPSQTEAASTEAPVEGAPVTEAKPEAALEAKAEAAPAAQDAPAVQEAKPEAKPEVKPEAKAEVESEAAAPPVASAKIEVPSQTEAASTEGPVEG